MESREISQLKTNPNNPRGEVVVDDSLRELTASIKTQGVLQPILITPDGTIVAGHRRVKACQLAGVNEVPVVTRDLNETEQIQIMLIENLQRCDLNPVQEGKAFAALISRGLTQNQIARATGIGNSKITNRLAVIALPDECHEAFASGRVPPSCIHCLSDMPAEKQIHWVLQAVDKNWPGTKLCSEIFRVSQLIEARQHFTVDKTLLTQVWKRIEDGCYTVEDIRTCLECGRDIFPSLDDEEIQAYMTELVGNGKAEWRKRGGKGDQQRGDMVTLCVPADLPSGSDFGASRREQWS